MRRLPEAHSLALRLRDSGAADDVICEYLRIEPEGLATLLELADQKVQADFGSSNRQFAAPIAFGNGRPLAADRPG